MEAIWCGICGRIERNQEAMLTIEPKGMKEYAYHKSCWDAKQESKRLELAEKEAKQ